MSVRVHNESRDLNGQEALNGGPSDGQLICPNNTGSDNELLNVKGNASNDNKSRSSQAAARRRKDQSKYHTLPVSVNRSNNATANGNGLVCNKNNNITSDPPVPNPSNRSKCQLVDLFFILLLYKCTYKRVRE